MLPDGIRILRMGYGCYGLDMYVTVEIRILRIICGIFTYVFFISADVAHAKWSSLGYATLIYKDAASILIIVSSSTVDFHRSLKMERERRLVLLDCLMTIQHNHMQMNILMAKMQAILDRRKERTCCVRHWITLRPHQGAYGNLMHLLRNEDVQGFRNFTRITPAIFADMVTRLTPRLQKYDTWYRKALPVGLKVAITMRYFASGDSYHSLMYLFYVPHNTISLLVLDVCEAIYAKYGEETISNPSTPEGWKDIAQTFSDRWNFHHCLGALDGKHIRIKAPANCGSEFYNYKGYNSIVLLALVDGNYKFRWVEVGAGGASSDAQIWNTCSLKEAIDDETIGIPPDEPLPHDDRDIPYFVIGDAAFALRTTLMKPFGAKPLTMEERIFNYRLSRARRCVENAFGILANRFRCFLSAMAQVPSTVETIVLACLCIHNLLRDQAPAEQNAMMDKEDDQHNIMPGAWREGAVLDDMQQRLAGNYTTKIAKRQRLYLKHYY